VSLGISGSLERTCRLSGIRTWQNRETMPQLLPAAVGRRCSNPTVRGRTRAYLCS